MSRILFISPYVPYPLNNGGRIRIFNLLRHLAVRHKVTLLTYFTQQSQDISAKSILNNIGVNSIFIKKPIRSRLYQTGKLFTITPYQYYRYWSDEMQNKIHDIVVQQNIDIIHIEHSYMGFFNLFFERPVKTVLDMQNIESDILWQTFKRSKNSLRKWFSLWEWIRFSRSEKHIVKQFDYITVVSREDRDWVQQYLRVGQKVLVVPNGVDLKFYSAHSRQKPKHIVFIGTMRYYPNVDAVLYFVKRIFPIIKKYLPNIKLYIVGQDPTIEIKNLHNNNDIIVTGLVNDVRPYLNKALVAVVPLRIGSGTRLKILEAWAAGVPVVTTSVGCYGLEFVPNEHLIVADNPNEFAKAVIKLVKNQNLRIRLSRAGMKLVERKYSWKAIFATIDDIYDLHITNGVYE